jgi:hypothetical protein
MEYNLEIDLIYDLSNLDCLNYPYFYSLNVLSLQIFERLGSALNYNFEDCNNMELILEFELLSYSLRLELVFFELVQETYQHHKDEKE